MSGRASFIVQNVLRHEYAHGNAFRIGEALLEVAIKNVAFSAEETVATLADAHGGTTGGEQLLKAQEVIRKVITAGNDLGFRRGLSSQVRFPSEQVEHCCVSSRSPSVGWSEERGASAVPKQVLSMVRIKRTLRGPWFAACFEMRADNVVVFRLALPRRSGGLFVTPWRAGEHETTGTVGDPRTRA